MNYCVAFYSYSVNLKFVVQAEEPMTAKDDDCVAVSETQSDKASSA